MEQFTASNGIVVRSSDTGVYMDKVEAGIRLYPADVDALREFFQHERDEELGRWRWPENPHFVVYSGREGMTPIRGIDALVFNELWGGGLEYKRDLDDDYEGVERPFADAACAYFEAHPERKPWEEAKEGEVWIIAYEGNEYPSIFQAGQFRDHGGHWTPESITDARRIWPVSDD